MASYLTLLAHRRSASDTLQMSVTTDRLTGWPV
jgi:hypothetical protein